MSPSGNELEVWTALPSTPYVAPFKKDCRIAFPYLGAAYNPCGYVTFYDQKWATSQKAPSTNVEEDASYDACGKLVTAGKTFGWHVIGTNYTLTGWHAGHESEVPASPAPCLGLWTLMYKWTQTFSDGETLTESVEVPFLVTATPIPGSETWGGGNPSEYDCSQACYGDPVNTATGDYWEATTDLAIGGRGPGLQMTRTYSSLAAVAGVSSPLGRGWSFSYDMSLEIDPETGVATVTNSNGSETRFSATPEGFEAEPRILATLTEGEGETYEYTIKERTTYTFDSAGKLIGISDLNGEETTLAYESGRLHTATDAAGRIFTFGYDEETGLLTGVSDSTGRSVSYHYDENENLDEVTDVRGEDTKFSYDEDALMLTRTDPRGKVALTNTYDTNGRPLTQTDAEENITTFSYAGSGLITTTTVTNPRGYVTEYEYRSGIITRKVEAVGTASEAKWSYEHDPRTLAITEITDPHNRKTRATYDSRGNQIFTEDALGRTTHAEYDSLNNLTEYTDEDGVTTTYEYDESGNLLSLATPLVGSEPPKTRTVTYTHGDEAYPGDVTAVTNPNGKTTTYGYDAAGNLTSLTDAEGNETTYTYDGLGRRLTEVRPRGNVEGAEPAEFTTTFSYDAAGNRLTASDPLGHEREWTYDANGNLETETDAEGRTTTYTYDDTNRLVSVEAPDEEVKSTTYDENGNVSSRSDGLENVTTYAYDPLDQLESSMDPLERTMQYKYDRVGNLLWVQDPGNRTTWFYYDDADQLLEIDYSDPSMADVQYEYDALGRQISMVDGTGESTYDYDSLGRVISVSNGFGDTVSYGYDLGGSLTGIVYPNKKSVSRAFDDAGRLESVSDWLGNTTSFVYDPDSNLKQTIFPESTGNVDEYFYDRADRLTGIEFGDGMEALASLAYTRNETGQVQSLTSQGLPGSESEAFEYDPTGRLLKAGSESFEYDDAGNLTKASGLANIYDAAGQLQVGGETEYRYDSLGNRKEAGAPFASFQSAFGSSGAESGQLSHPAGIAIDAEGNLWVVDMENDRVEKFNSAGEYLSSFGSSGSGAGQFLRPTDVAIDQEGHLWVTDAGGNRVEEFNAAGEFLDEFGSGGSGNGEFSEPESIAVDSEGDIWVADTYNGRLQEFNAEGEFQRVVGELGEEAGQIYEAVGVDIGPEDSIWVADWGNNRVAVFDAGGKFVRQFGTKGSGRGELQSPDAIDVDGAGNVWVADEGNDRVQAFTEEGKFKGQFGASGNGEGEFAFAWPIGIAVDGVGNVWISDSENDRVQKWKFSNAAPAATFDYDQGGHLVGLEHPELGESPPIQEKYEYDGGGLLVSHDASGTTRQLTWDLASPLPLLLSDEAASYIYGPNGLPVQEISAGGAVKYYHQDQLGSTRMLTNGSGEVTAEFSYGAFGELVASTGSASTPFGYAGQYTSSESGLQYLRARFYDPATRQFLSRDPLEEVTGEPYAYAGNNPVNRVDPTGLCNANPLDSSFWTEGNCISESSLNPIPYYEREIEAWEAGCSYWESIVHGLKGAGVLATDAAGLYGVARAAAGRAVTVVFGHGSRHLAGTGLAQAQVEAAIQAQVASQLARATAGGSFWGRVVVNGQTVTYRAFVRPDGTVNVGTYYVP